MLQGLHRVGIGGDKQDGTVKAKCHQFLQASQFLIYEAQVKSDKKRWLTVLHSRAENRLC